MISYHSYSFSPLCWVAHFIRISSFIVYLHSLEYKPHEDRDWFIYLLFIILFYFIYLFLPCPSTWNNTWHISRCLVRICWIQGGTWLQPRFKFSWCWWFWSILIFYYSLLFHNAVGLNLFGIPGCRISLRSQIPISSPFPFSETFKGLTVLGCSIKTPCTFLSAN